VAQGKRLLIGSHRSSSGKSATILGIALQLQKQGFTIGYGKPLGTFTTAHLPDSAPSLEADVAFITDTLQMPPQLICPTLVNLDKNSVQQRLKGIDQQDYTNQLKSYHHNQSDLLLIEAPANTAEGALFGLSLRQMAEALDSPIVLVARYQSLLVVDHVLIAKKRLGAHLIGTVINDIPKHEYDDATQLLPHFLAEQGVPVLAMMPENLILRSVSVAELVNQLEAVVLLQPEYINLAQVMIEDLKIGAMDVNSARLFFRQSHNKAVITGSNRVDLQLAALETSTNCLFLTGTPFVSEEVRDRAMELGVPIISVNKDTLTTVGTIEGCLGHVRLQEGIKVEVIRQMMQHYFNFDLLLQLLDLSPSTRL
jgi:BioD-like phosphotransacetylase family protein